MAWLLECVGASVSTADKHPANHGGKAIRAASQSHKSGFIRAASQGKISVRAVITEEVNQEETHLPDTLKGKA
jgi:hypothetical protein